MRLICTVPLVAVAVKAEDEATLLAMTSSVRSSALMQDLAHRNVSHLEGLMQNMVADSISGDGTAADDVQALLNNIKELLLGEIRGVLQDEHNIDQAAIYNLKSCFHDCKNDFTEDRRGDAELKEHADAEQLNHEVCRTKVHSAYIDKVQKCNSLDTFIDSLSFPTGYKEKCEPLSTKMGEVFEKGIAWYTQNFESWRFLHETCVAAYHKYDALDTECDMTQGAFETSTCSHAQSMWTSCSVNQKTCCARCAKEFHREISRVECAERDRKIDWSATEKIECYVDILLNSPTDEELKARCNGENCLSKWRQSEYDKCNLVCAEVDFEYSTYQHVGADGSAADNWQEGATASEVNTTHRKDSNTVGRELASGAHQSHDGAVSWDGKGLRGARCTRHLDIDFIQMPPCESCPPLPPTPCSGQFITKYYSEYDKTDRITLLSTSKECAPDVHTEVWGYNRAVCRECGPLIGREVDVDEWSYFEVEIGKNTHHGKKCVNLHYPVVCDGNAGNPGIRVNSESDTPDTFSITVEGADSKRVCAERTDATTGHDVAIEGAEETHYEQDNQIGKTWGMNLRIQCKAIVAHTKVAHLCAGTTPPGATDWKVYSDKFIFLDVDTSKCKFAETPTYVTALQGTTSHWTSKGSSEIYSPTATGFRIYIHMEVTPAVANDREYAIHWIASSQQQPVPGVCQGQAANWRAYSSNMVQTVDTSDCNFAVRPVYVTSVQGTSSHWDSTGSSEVYAATASSFDQYIDGSTPAQAASHAYKTNFLAVDAASSSKGSCAGRTSENDWVRYNDNGIYVDVDTSKCGFETTPVIVSSLHGTSNHWVSTGSSELYSPTATGFRIYISTTSDIVNNEKYKGWQWSIEWVAVAQA